MADKKLVIALDGKVSPSFQSMVKTLEGVTAGTAKASKAMQTLSGTGGSGAANLQQAGIAKSLLAQKKLFDDLGASGTKLSKVLNEQVTRAQVALQKALTTNATSLAPLIKQYEAAQSRVSQLQNMKGVDPSRISLAQRYAERAGHAVGQTAAERQQMQAMYGELAGGDAGAPTGGAAARGGGGFGGFGGIGGALVSRAGVPMGGALMAIGGAASVVAVAAAAAIVVGKMIVTNSQGLNSVMAASGGSMSQIVGQSGSVAYQSARREMETNRRAVRSLDQSTLPGALRMAPAGALNLLTSFAHIGGVGYWNAFDAKQNQDQLERNQAMLNQMAEARGPMAEAAQARLDDASARFAHDFRYGEGSYERVAELGARSGFPGLAGHMATVSQSVGARGAESYTSRVIQARNQGMDPAQAAGIIGRSAVGGINALDYSGRFDPVMRGILGEAAVANMGPTGAMYAGRGAAYSEALSNSVNFGGGAAGVRQAQQATAGFGLLSQRAGGHDPYQMSANIAAASAALGPGATPYAREFLATQLRDPDFLAKIRKGELPAQFESMNINLDQAQAAARALDRTSTGARYIDNPKDQSPAAKMMRAFKAAGGPSAWAADKTAEERQAALTTAAPLYAMVHKGATGGDIGSAEGLLAAEMGLGGRAKAGGAGRKETALGAEAREARARDASQQETLWKAYLANMEKEVELRVRLNVSLTDQFGKTRDSSTELERLTKQIKAVRGIWQPPVFAPGTGRQGE